MINPLAVEHRELWEPSAGPLEIMGTSQPSSVSGQMAPTVPERAVRPSASYLWSLIKVSLLKGDPFLSSEAEIPRDCRASCLFPLEMAMQEVDYLFFVLLK